MQGKADVELARLKALFRFRDKIKITPVRGPYGGCWLWKAAVHGGHGKASRYRCGSFWYKGRVVSAHVWIWEQVHGKIPRGKQINHDCGRDRCVNPEHMYLGTQAQNVKDMHDHGQANGKQRGGRIRRKKA